MPVPLAMLVGLVASYLVEGNPPDFPQGGGTGGLSDADLGQRILTGGDVLDGWTFEQAVRDDPRRIDALIQMQILSDFFDALSITADSATGRITSHAYVLGYDDIRAEHGAVTAPILNRELQTTWDDYEALLNKAIWPMADRGAPEAQALQEALTANQQGIHRAIHQARAIAMRAAEVAATQEDTEAWQNVSGTLGKVWDKLAERLDALDVLVVPQLEGPTGDESGFAGTEQQYHGVRFEEFLRSGHRYKPFNLQAALPSFRRAGGRVF